MTAWLLATVVALAGDPSGEAIRFLEACRDGKFATAAERFDATMTKLLPAEKLGETWTMIIGQVGPLKSLGKPRVEKPGLPAVVLVRCEFKAMALDASVSFDKDGQIDGFYLRPAKPIEPPKPAPYVDPSRFEEREVTVGAEGWPLKAALARPKGKTPAPLVILVHGSGPHDRDESIGPNAPFRDLGQGLASRGVATLRYEKRTHAHGARMKATDVHINAEVIDDALATIVKARSFEGIDPKRIYLLGHSLGGTVGPEIARRDGKLAGLILMAAAARPLDEVIEEQIRYVAGLEANPSKESRERVEEIERAVRRYRSGTAKPGDTILGAPVSYWKSLDELRPVRVAAGLKDLPILILQGGRDYQVTEADLTLFREGLKGRPNVAIELYGDLNHLFRVGKGKAVPAEYGQAGHVDARVIERIAKWVGGEG